MRNFLRSNMVVLMNNFRSFNSKQIGKMEFLLHIVWTTCNWMIILLRRHTWKWMEVHYRKGFSRRNLNNKGVNTQMPSKIDQFGYLYLTLFQYLGPQFIVFKILESSVVWEGFNLFLEFSMSFLAWFFRQMLEIDNWAG